MLRSSAEVGDAFARVRWAGFRNASNKPVKSVYASVSLHRLTRYARARSTYRLCHHRGLQPDRSHLHSSQQGEVRYAVFCMVR